MSQDWPSQRPRGEHSLPTTDDLSLTAGGDGYQRESVDEAFEAFYRHIAQLDTTLRTLEAVESFRQQAGELRADLRSIRAAGWTPYARGYPALPAGGFDFALPEALPRLAVEVAFLVAVAAVLAVGSFSAVTIVAVMACAVVLAAGFEWIANRNRRTTPLPLTPPAIAAPPPPPVVVDAVPVADGAGWAAFSDEPVIEAVAEVVEPADTEDAEPEPEPAPEPEPEPEPEPAGEATAEIEATDPVEPSVVRDLDPWERGFDETMHGEEQSTPVKK